MRARVACLDDLQTLLRGAADLLVGLALVGEREQQHLRVRVPRTREALDRLEARAAVGALQVHCRGDHLERRFDVGIGFLRERLANERQHGRRGAARKLLHRGGPHRPIRRHQLERRHRRLELAAQAIVHHDVLASFGQRSDCRPGDRVGRGLALDDDHPRAGDLHLAVGERLQEHRRALLARGEQRGDGGDLLVAVAARELRDHGGVERVRIATGEEHQCNDDPTQQFRSSKRRRRLRAAVDFLEPGRTLTTSWRRPSSARSRAHPSSCRCRR